MDEINDELKYLTPNQRSKLSPRWKKGIINVKKIEESKIPFRMVGEIGHAAVCCFRESNKPMVNFHPCSGRWNIVGTQEHQPMQEGSVEQFLEWYRNLNEI